MFFIFFFSWQEKCKQVVDKYVEFDPVIVLLDALLFKPQAYRHVLFNKVITVSHFVCILSVYNYLCIQMMRMVSLMASLRNFVLYITNV